MKREYSRILKFDFPTIPILGTLLLLLIFLNDSSLLRILMNEKGKPEFSSVATSIVFLGTAGITLSQLISFSLFNRFYQLKKLILSSKKHNLKDTGHEWFYNLTSNMVPIERKKIREGVHRMIDRRTINNLCDGQIDATLHALEINSRERHPEIASQIEYFYAMYIIFSILGLAAFVIPFIVTVNSIFEHFGVKEILGISISINMFFFDLILCCMCLSAAIQARRFKEHLRIKLLNSCRLEVIELLSKWFQVELISD